MLIYIRGGFQRGSGCRFLPRFGNGRAALVADAAVIRRKAREHDKGFGRESREQTARAERFPSPASGASTAIQPNAGGAGLPFFFSESSTPCVDLENSRRRGYARPPSRVNDAVKLVVFAGFHPGVNQRLRVAVDPQANRMVGTGQQTRTRPYPGPVRCPPSEWKNGADRTVRQPGRTFRNRI